MKKSWKWVCVVLLSGAVSACTPGEEPLPYSGNHGSTNADTGDVGVGDGDGEEDVYEFGDVGGTDEYEHRCGSAPIEEWPLHNTASTASVSSESHEDYQMLVVDASAGGMQAARQNPFVYVSLETGERVDVTDVEALDDERWDLAFKRVVIRTNSADSGPGDGRLAKISGTTFEEVTESADLSDPHHRDVSFEENCDPILDPLGSLFTAFNYLNPMTSSRSWYEYGSGGASGVVPVEGDVYVFRRDDRDAIYKIEILGWSSGEYTLRWAPLAE